MAYCKPANTPVPSGSVFAYPDDVFMSVANTLLYRERFGVLTHLSNTVRPDITYSVNVLARFMNSYDYVDWNAPTYILIYPNNTRHHGILYQSGSDDRGIYGYSDADFACDGVERKSTTGYVFMNGAPVISWRRKEQSVVA